MNAVRNACISHGAYLPSFPLKDMSLDDLEHTASSPHRFRALIQEHDGVRLAAPLLTRRLMPRAPRQPGHKLGLIRWLLYLVAVSFWPQFHQVICSFGTLVSTLDFTSSYFQLQHSVLRGIRMTFGLTISRQQTSKGFTLSRDSLPIQGMQTSHLPSSYSDVSVIALIWLSLSRMKSTPTQCLQLFIG